MLKEILQWIASILIVLCLILLMFLAVIHPVYMLCLLSMGLIVIAAYVVKVMLFSRRKKNDS